MGEGFQLDSSLSYHSGDNEGIEGDLDVVIPLLNLGRHVLFVQPGAVFWTGLEEEERIDGNIGLVYRAELTRGLVAGASVFYDHDFQIGHSRAGGGVDLQSGFFRLGANYYHPLSEVEDGREGFVEEALRGGDLQFAFERDVVRLGSTIGYWEYDGGEDVEDEWKTSFGLDFGVRILPGVFAEASWERHKDDTVLDERIFAGLAFKFSLPGFEGASYGSGEMTSNLYKIVDREKRILYEERVAGPTISIVRTGTEAIDADARVTIPVDVRLSKALTENVTINLVGSGTATYNDDYTVSVGGTDCTGITGDDCQVTITAGQLTPGGDVTITIIDDGRTNEPDESIILSMVVASPANTDLLPRGSVALTIPADLPPPPLPTVSISATSRSITEGGSATLTATLSETLTENVVINLLEGGAADYGTSMDWHLNNGSDCNTATGTSCQITITAGQQSATATVNVNTDTNDETTAETFTVSIDIASPDSTVVIEGSPSMLNFTIPADPATVSLIYGGNTGISRQSTPRMRIELNRAASQDITLNIVGTGSAAANYEVAGGTGTNGTWELQYRVLPAGGTLPAFFENGTACQSIAGTGCPIMIREGQTIVDIEIYVLLVPSGRDIILTLGIDQASSSFVTLGSSSTQTLTIN